MGGEQLLKRKERVWHSAQTALLKATMARQKEKQKGITQTTHTSRTRFTCITCNICITCIKCITHITCIPFLRISGVSLVLLVSVVSVVLLYFLKIWKHQLLTHWLTDKLKSRDASASKNMQEHLVGSICMSQRLSCLRDLRAKINRQNRKVISHIDTCVNLILYK